MLKLTDEQIAKIRRAEDRMIPALGYRPNLLAALEGMDNWAKLKQQHEEFEQQMKDVDIAATLSNLNR